MFLWRHRIATFQTLKVIFFSQESPKTAYFRLKALSAGGFLRIEKITGTPNKIIFLGKRGFEFLSANLLPDDLAHQMYQPHRQYHDLMAMSALLGDWYASSPKNVRIVTEQELATTHISDLPIHLRKSLNHKPDGLWIYTNGEDKKAIALEVEITAKSSPRYEKICAFYTSELFFEKVIWIVANKTLGNRILDDSRYYGNSRENLHLFVEQADFEKNLWQSKVMNKSFGGATMAEVLNSLVKPVNSNALINGLKQVSSESKAEAKHQNQNFFLDFGFRLGIPTAYGPRVGRQNS